MPRVLARERLGEHGELRAFVREGPPEHLAFEVLQDSDGRAWTLRVPLADRTRLSGVLRAVGQRLARAEPLAFGADGTVMLAREPLSVGDELVALAMHQADQAMFALWRRERVRDGWEWTLDALFVPLPLASQLCASIDAASAQ